MSRKEKIHLNPKTTPGEQPDEQIISDLMAKRKLQQDALKKIMTSIDKNTDEGDDSKEVKHKTKLN